MHSFCCKTYVSDFKTDCIKNIYKVWCKLFSYWTDERTSYSILDTVDVCIVNNISSPIHSEF